MTRYLLRRLAGMVVVMFLVATIVFVIAHVIPGDPAAVMLGPSATAADIAALRSRLGLDAPLPVQYVQFLHSVIRLRLGESIFLSRSVTQALAERAPLTLQLTVLAAGLATLIGVPIGVLSAVKRGSVVDQVLTAAAMAGASLPSFWIGLTLIEYLAVRLHLLPVAGYGPPDAGVLERLYLSHHAGDRAWHPEFGAHHALHPHQHAGRAAGGLRAHRARQGSGAGNGDLQACVPQCAHLGADGDRADRRRACSAAPSSPRRCSPCLASAISSSPRCCGGTTR